MASINVGGAKGGKKNKPQKQNLRVDFTPMVDMNMLLLTFFMFCTTLSISQVMDLAMPSKDIPDPPSLTPERYTTTLLLGADNKIFYYTGKPDYENYAAMKEMDYSGLRDLLLTLNTENVQEIRLLKQKLVKKLITQEKYKEELKEIKQKKNSPTILIKPTNESTYRNLVDALDEMQICGIGKYMINEIEPSDNFMLDNYTTKGGLVAQLKP